MPPSFARFRLAVRALLLLTLGWAAVVVTSTLLDHRRYQAASEPVCGLLEAAHAVRENSFAWPWAREGSAWSVHARYTYMAGGARRSGTQVWPWGQEGSREAVHEAAQQMRQQQGERGCVQLTVATDQPDRAIVFQTPLRAYMQRQMANIAPVFLLLLFVELALALWAGWRQARQDAPGRRASAT